MDISGKWKYSEDFGFGKDVGFAELEQNEKEITGYLEYTESIDDEPDFTIRQYVKGSFDGTNLRMRGTSFELIQAQEDLTYHLDSWEGVHTYENKLVGCTNDNEGCYGVFVLERMS